jgi:pyruvate/2-oxoglutarate dehydrogenase complex dihydrolipoamide dehydrogenase (E3) component
MARRMTLEDAKVLGVVEINPFSSGLARNIRQCLDDFDIPLYLSHTVSNVIGKNRIEKAIISKVDESFNIIPNTEIEFEIDTLLLSVGLIPYITLLKNAGAKIINNKLFVYDNVETSIPGIFVAGNALHVHDIVDYVTEEGRKAATGVYKYLNGHNFNKQINVLFNNNISYVVPNVIREDDEILNIKFRTKANMQSALISITNNNQTIYSRKMINLNPSILVNISLEKSKIISWDHPIEVKVNLL